MGGSHSSKYIKSTDAHNHSYKTVHYNTSSVDAIQRSYVVVWCDATIGLETNSVDDANTLMKLAPIVNKKRQLIHTFNDLNACQSFISNVNNICLIVSGQMGTELIPLVHDLEQIHSIYIFCLNKPKYESWAKQYKKVHGVFTEIDEICGYLERYFVSQTSFEFEQLQIDLLNENIPSETNDKQDVLFIYSILSKKILLNINLIKQEDMINYCRKEYTDDYQIQLINEFENKYSKYDPIWWFTRDNFFQSIIHRALQIHDLYTLCYMSPFIKDIEKRITELNKKQISSSTKTFKLYSSQSMSIENFDKLKSNKNGRMCINQFLFANIERYIALMFIEHQNLKTINSNIIYILFEITVTPTIESIVSYANIGTISDFVHDKEYLISMSSIFSIEKIEQLREIPTAYCVHLRLIDKNDVKLTKTMQSIETDQLNESDNLSELGSTIMNTLYQFESTRKLYEQVFNFRTKQIRSTLVHYNMGIIYYSLKEYEKALDEYSSVKNIIRASTPNGYEKDSLCLIPIYSNMGLAFQQLDIFNKAFEHAFRALTILENNQENSTFKKEFFAGSYFNLGLIHEEQGKYSEAKAFYERALKCRRGYLSEDHPDITSLQDIIKSLSSESETL